MRCIFRQAIRGLKTKMLRYTTPRYHHRNTAAINPPEPPPPLVLVLQPPPLLRLSPCPNISDRGIEVARNYPGLITPGAVNFRPSVCGDKVCYPWYITPSYHCCMTPSAQFTRPPCNVLQPSVDHRHPSRCYYTRRRRHRHDYWRRAD